MRTLSLVLEDFQLQILVFGNLAKFSQELLAFYLTSCLEISSRTFLCDTQEVSHKNVRYLEASCIEAVRAVTVLDVAAIRSSRIFPSIPCKDRVEPCLASLKSKLPQGDEWSYEIKWDGYRSGRTGDWLKIKCIQSDSFAIIGYEPSTALPGAIASLLLGARSRDGYKYVGSVGTGFKHDEACRQKKMLNEIENRMPVGEPASE